MGKVVHQLLLPPAAWLACALDRRLASASVSSKAIIAILSKTRPIARMVFLPVRLSCGQCKRRGGVAAEQANELAPLHLDDLSARTMPSIAGRSRASQQKRAAHVRLGSKPVALWSSTRIQLRPQTGHLCVNEYTPFCNGPGDVKSPRVIVTPPSSRFCPWSTLRPPHCAVRGSGEPSVMGPVMSSLPE